MGQVDAVLAGDVFALCLLLLVIIALCRQHQAAIIYDDVK